MKNRSPYPTFIPKTTHYLSNDLEEQRDGVVVEENGDLRLIRDEETGDEVYRFRWELSQ